MKDEEAPLEGIMGVSVLRFVSRPVVAASSLYLASEPTKNPEDKIGEWHLTKNYGAPLREIPLE